MNSVLLWIGGLLVAVLGLLFAVPYVVDWNAYRGVFEEEASRVLGRDVRVGGRVNLRLLPAPYVRFEKVRISDTKATLGEPFFRAESFTLWLSTGPLLRGVIEANSIELDTPVLRLAVEPDGRGNWQALGFAPGALPFAPSNVVLSQVLIRNGSASVRTDPSAQPIALDGVDGEISAAALTGPYRFRGNVRWAGSVRELRLATAAQEPDGRVRFKASLREPASGSAYALDGSISELTPKGRIAGALTAKLPIASAIGQAGSKPKPGAPESAVDLTASIDGDIGNLKISDLTLAFENDGKPQLLTGEAAASWRNDVRLEARLASRWLDLDRLAADAGATTPLAATRRLIEQLGTMLPVEGTTFASVDIDQVNLGGEGLSGVRLALARAGGLTSIGELKAALPGNAKVELRGTLGAGGETGVFDGEVVLYGASYQRFAVWASGGVGPSPARNPLAALGRRDGAFSIASHMRLHPGRFELAGASVELGATQVMADLDWQWTGARKLQLALEGEAIDVSALAPGILQLGSLTQPTAGTAPEGPAQPHPAAAPARSPLADVAARAQLVNDAVGNLRLRIRARQLTDGQTTLADVDTDLAYDSGNLSIATLKLTTPDGIVLDAQGDLKALASKPTGRVRGWVTVSQPKAVAALAGLVSPEGARGPLDIGGTVRRAELGFTIQLGGAVPDQLVLRAQGTVDDGQAALALRLDGGTGAWRNAPIDLTLDVEAANVVDLLRRRASPTAAAATAAAERPPGESRPGTLRIKAAGASASALTALAQLEARGITLAYTGRAAVAQNGSIDLAGDVRLAAASAGDLMGLAGISRRLGLGAAQVDGTLGVVRKDGGWQLVSRGLDIGGSRVSGQIALVAKGEATRIEGKIAASQASVQGLLGMVLDGERPAAAAGAAGGDGAAPANAWPDAQFSFAGLDGLEGRVTLTTPSLRMGEGLELAGASVDVELAPRRLALTGIGGEALGGRVAAQAVVEQAPAGASISVDARLAGGRLERLLASQAGAPARALGEASLRLSLSGRAASPAGAVATLSGKGEIEVVNARVRGIAPSAIDRSAMAALDSSDELTRDGLERMLRQELAKGEVAIGSRKLAVEVADGALKIAAFQVETPDALLRNATTIDLAGFKADSEWRLAPRRPLPLKPGTAGPARKDPLPALAVVWTGPLARIAQDEPRLSVDALETELLLRKSERDAERLAELRRQDEERARVEADRLRRLDESSRGPGAGQAMPQPPVIYAPFPLPPATRPGGAAPPGTPTPLPPAVPPRRQSASDPPVSPTATPPGPLPGRTSPPPRTLEERLLGGP